MRVGKAALAYFAIVFAVGFALGTLRVLLVVPRLGVRTAELAELPLMLLASFFAARWCMRRWRVQMPPERLVAGLMALALLVGAEIGLVLAQGQDIAGYIAARDPVSGVAYLLSLAMFALMPLLAGARERR